MYLFHVVQFYDTLSILKENNKANQAIAVEAKLYGSAQIESLQAIHDKTLTLQRFLSVIKKDQKSSEKPVLHFVLTSNGVKGELTFLKTRPLTNGIPGKITYAGKIHFSFKRKFSLSFQTQNNILK